MSSLRYGWRRAQGPSAEWGRSQPSARYLVDRTLSRWRVERDVASVADDPCADLDQLFLRARQRPIFDGLGRRRNAQELPEFIGERTKLKAAQTGSSNPSTISSTTTATRGASSSINPGKSCRSVCEFGPMSSDHRVLVLEHFSRGRGFSLGARAVAKMVDVALRKMRGRIESAGHGDRKDRHRRLSQQLTGAFQPNLAVMPAWGISKVLPKQPLKLSVRESHAGGEFAHGKRALD